jgi:hypothetical protein
LTKSAQYDDGDVFYEHVAFESAKNIEPRHFGQHHIEQDKIGNVLASDAETLFPVPGLDNTVPSLDQRPFICNPLKLAVFDQEYFHFLSLVNFVLMRAF